MLGLFAVPSIISSALNFAAPLFAGFIKFTGWFLTEFWNGLKHIMKDLSSLVVIAVVAGACTLYGTQIVKCESVFSNYNNDGPIIPSEKPWSYDFGIR